ncbi:MAG: PPOX class F420-dependent oxidoreductase [bacterium]|nr:PPOX class F420-dependent oxidoreductase [bacterium]MCP5068975.1 PPOX class F420-dependent oxidoreductase [bacterium]
MTTLGDESYVSLATFRKSGAEVRTPVWIAPSPTGDVLYVYTNRTSGKVKRIRNDSRVCLAPCTASGRVTGDWSEAQARMLDTPNERDIGLDAVVRKYGLQMQIALFASRITGRHADRTAIEIRVSG